MKKLLMILLLVGIGLTGCKPKNPEMKIADMKGYGILSDKFYELTMVESYELLTNGTGYIYYGFDKCPWCLELVPILDEITKEYDFSIYYVNVRPDGKDIRSFDDPTYTKVVELTKAFLELNEEGLPWLWVPQLFAAENGKVTAAHDGTYPGHDARVNKMNDEERAELKASLLTFFQLTK